MRLPFLRCAALSALLALLAGGAIGAAKPAAAQALQLERAFPGLAFDSITDVQPTAGGQLFVVEQPGRIQTFDPSAEEPQKSVFLDITGRVASGGERGLLGLAFHPDYAANGRFFVNYTQERSTGGGTQLYTRIAEFDAGAADVAASETLVLEVAQPQSNHNAGQLQFGPADGLLYVALGDGGGSGDPNENGQDLTTLLGAMLRLDVDGSAGGGGAGNAPDCGGPEASYTIPAGNPFASDPGACGEIFAYGFRNPFRFSFGPEGVLFAGDVGQGRREEIDVVRSGQNYGWNETEGSLCYPAGATCDPSQYALPAVEYDHDDGGDGTPGGRSVTGGYVFTLDCASCGPVRGRYFYGDFISGNIWSLAYDAEGNVTDNRLEVDASGLSISTFGRTAEGELLIADRDGSSSALYRFDRSTLPVELVAFEARPDGEDVALTWQTASETNNDRFAVEWARGGAAGNADDWKALGSVPTRVEGGGTTAAPQRYQFRATGLGYGRHRFRLRQFDRDGTSRLVARTEATVTPQAAFALSEAYPNPARQRATVELALREAARVTVALYDVRGRQVALLHDGALASGAVRRFTVGAQQELASGLYLLRVEGEGFSATRAVTLLR